jgi:nitroimidazol reductase NimA-like FMN-containing flavoprotein (pyridoxamine 5'-phosphate oxidase superfamily)
MGIALEDDELWQYVAGAHTGVVTTLRRNGWPVTLPVWHVVLARRIYFKTFPTMAKAARIARDPRASFLAEDGRRWTELRAVSLPVTAEILSAGAEDRAARDALAHKYPPEVDVPLERLPAASRAYYGAEDVIVRLTPAGPPLSWDNRRLRLLPAPPGNA